MSSRRLADGAAPLRRRSLLGLAAAGSALLAGCDRLSRSDTVQRVLGFGETLTRLAHQAVPRAAMAQEFSAADLSPEFRSNGTAVPDDEAYALLARGGFADYRLVVDGLVEQPLRLSLDDVRALPSRTQITRHDCVEGWSAIGQWKGARLGPLLERARPRREARYVVFHCADPMEEGGRSPYYESIDFDDAWHVQTILAYELNGRTLPIANGAPLRVRIERQLGYKMAKYIMRIELVDSYAGIRGGKGGYWEDQGYQWWAGA
jgi:DMSO/TMAO reductase YedYZ molybdopterin-dependent catalytic subunit